MRKKIILTLIMAISAFCLNVACVYSAELNANMDYDNGILKLNWHTDAKYGQRVAVVIYKLNEIPEKQYWENPEAQYPVSSSSQIVRMCEFLSNYDGNGSCDIKFSDADGSGYYVISAQGGGYLLNESKDSKLIYIESKEETATITLPNMNTIGAEGLDQALKEKQLFFELEFNTKYEDNKDYIGNIFVNVRKDVYNNNFLSISDVKEALNISYFVLDTYYAENETALKNLCETLKQYLNFNFDDSNYTANVNSIYTLMLSKVKKNKPMSSTDITNYIKEATAIATINKCNAVSATNIITTLYDDLGLSLQEYTEQCGKYGGQEVNKAFVNRNFTSKEDVVKAFNDRIKGLSEQIVNKYADSYSPAGSGGGSSGGGSFGGGSISVNVPAQSISDSGMNIISNDSIVFKDIDNTHWSYDCIRKLADAKILNGFEDGTFRPDESVTREQFVKIIGNAFKFESIEKENAFFDVPSDNYALQDILNLVECGIIAGVGERTFGFGKEISRQDAVTIIYRVLKYMNIPLKQNKKESFEDSDIIADYAAESVTALANAGIISGNENKFNPLNSLTRAEASKIIYEAMIY